MPSVIDYLGFACRILIGLVLMSSGFTKTDNWDHHINTIRGYRLLPESLLKPAGFALAVSEVLLGSAMVLGVGLRAAGLATSVIMVLYGLAISVNLLRGNRNIECGCGGVLGAHKISWWLSARNLALAAVSLWLSWDPPRWMALWSQIGESVGSSVVAVGLANLGLALGCWVLNETLATWRTLNRINEGL